MEPTNNTPHSDIQQLRRDMDASPEVQALIAARDATLETLRSVRMKAHAELSRVNDQYSRQEAESFTATIRRALNAGETPAEGLTQYAIQNAKSRETYRAVEKAIVTEAHMPEIGAAKALYDQAQAAFYNHPLVVAWREASLAKSRGMSLREIFGQKGATKNE